MFVLGIETSCDETAIALLKCENGKSIILAEEISSQTEVHELYGGVVPELASREHLKNLPIVLKKVLETAKFSIKDIDLISVTRGPGLKGCLLMGLQFAKGLSQSLGLPLVGVNHIEGHVLAPMLDNESLKFPYLCLVVSGGHTELHEVKDVGNYRLISKTSDDAAGEAFDKSAHLLGLTYPGGPQLAALADNARSSTYILPKVMRGQEGFSFSGLKTAISLLIKRESGTNADQVKKESLCYAIQEAIVETLMYKVNIALKETGLRSFCITGGVAANKRLREVASSLKGINTYFPDSKHSTDNGAMIGYVGYLRFLKGQRLGLSESALARWRIETL
ncbi:MAG: tRNA (adenosine(37)-N6)-threonylcarbamoyltransferase complex transferase subunit TsaD [bacterium]|nr:tRNA (adenosine(37)-N6)-threonylcarbamoyltransferase complex transferase subunit TsaD [bacterium]